MRALCNTRILNCPYFKTSDLAFLFILKLPLPPFLWDTKSFHKAVLNEHQAEDLSLPIGALNISFKDRLNGLLFRVGHCVFQCFGWSLLLHFLPEECVPSMETRQLIPRLKVRDVLSSVVIKDTQTNPSRHRHMRTQRHSTKITTHLPHRCVSFSWPDSSCGFVWKRLTPSCCRWRSPYCHSSPCDVQEEENFFFFLMFTILCSLCLLFFFCLFHY